MAITTKKNSARKLAPSRTRLGKAADFMTMLNAGLGLVVGGWSLSNILKARLKRQGKRESG